MKRKFHDGRSTKNEYGSGYLMIPIDIDQKTHRRTPLPPVQIELISHEMIIKGKMTMTRISAKHKTGHPQYVGETQVDRSGSEEHLFQCAQMDEPVLDAFAIPLEIFWNHLEQYCFGEPNIRMLQRCDVKIFWDDSFDPTKCIIFIDLSFVKLASRSELAAWKWNLVLNLLLL
jgi:hypothetical protein